MVEHEKKSKGPQKIFVDIDETICFYTGRRSYELAEPSYNNISKINSLYDQGNIITYYTARGKESKIDYFELTERQLKDWGCKYHFLITGTKSTDPKNPTKPSWDLIIDDKSKRIEEIGI